MKVGPILKLSQISSCSENKIPFSSENSESEILIFLSNWAMLLGFFDFKSLVLWGDDFFNGLGRQLRGDFFPMGRAGKREIRFPTAVPSQKWEGK